MTKFIKIILFLLFAWILNIAANNVFADMPVETQNYTHEYSESHPQDYSNAQLPYLPEGELTVAQSQQILTTRLQRYSMLEYSLALKGALQSLLSRVASLTQHFGKIYDTTASQYCQSATEYYVFTLRRIII